MAIIAKKIFLREIISSLRERSLFIPEKGAGKKAGEGHEQIKKSRR